jgi:DNA-binding protein YbaB
MKTPVEGVWSAQIMGNFECRPITVNEQLIDPVDDELFCAKSCFVSFAKARK